MTEQTLAQLKYPVGKFVAIDEWNQTQIDQYIQTIQAFPSAIIDLVKSLNETTLQNKYRPNGWTIAQVVNHCADSHMNAFIRFKLSLTENNPTIKPYDEAAWAELADGTNLDITLSVQLIVGLHARWLLLLKSMHLSDFDKTYIHPEHNKNFTLANALATYDWHCRHHLAHIQLAIKNHF
jgi:DinB superfamily